MHGKIVQKQEHRSVRSNGLLEKWNALKKDYWRIALYVQMEDWEIAQRSERPEQLLRSSAWSATQNVGETGMHPGLRVKEYRPAKGEEY